MPTDSTYRQRARRAFPILSACERCGSTSNLQRHHPHLPDALSVVILCRQCHTKEHVASGSWKGRGKGRERKKKPSSVHRSIRYRLYSRPTATRNLLAYFVIGGHRYDRSTGTPILNLACDRTERMIDDLLDGAPASMPLQGLVDRILLEREKLVAEGHRKVITLDRQRPCFQRFVNFCKDRGVGDVAQLNAQVVADYRAFLRHDLGFKVSTVELETSSSLRAILRRAFALGYTREDLTEKIVREETRSRKKARRLTRPELAGILRALRAQPDGRQRTRIVRFLMLTGCRRDQARLLRWQDVNLNTRRAKLLAQKGDKEPRTIPLHRRLVWMLTAMERRARCARVGFAGKVAAISGANVSHVCLGGAKNTAIDTASDLVSNAGALNAMPAVTASHVRDLGQNGRTNSYVFGKIPSDRPNTWFRRAAKDAGVVGYTKLHQLRDSFISSRLSELSIPEVAYLVGHKDWRVTREYYQESLDEIQRKVDGLR